MAPKEKKRIKHVPNKFSRAHLLWNIALAMFLILCGAGAIYGNALRLPASRGRSIAVLSDGPMWLALGAVLCGVMALLSVVIDHMDRRDNEREYAAFRWLALRLGGAFLASSLIAHFYLTLMR